MSLAARIPEIDQLGVVERLQLIEEIWDSISDLEEVAEIPQSHKDELDRRLAAMEADPLAGSSWEEVQARLRKRSEPSR